jgi:hypothetical protein
VARLKADLARENDLDIFKSLTVVNHHHCIPELKEICSRLQFGG